MGYAMTYPEEKPASAGPGNSWLGIASSAIGIAASVGVCLGMGTVYLTIGLPILRRVSWLDVAAMIVVFLGTALSFLGLVLGVIALLLKRHRKVAAVLGVMINGVLFLGMAGHVVLGLCIKAGVFPHHPFALRP